MKPAYPTAGHGNRGENAVNLALLVFRCYTESKPGNFSKKPARISRELPV